MRIFIFKRIEDLTQNYHSDAGVVVIARDVERAREIISKGRAEWEGQRPLTIPEPDAWLELAGEPLEDEFVFPDAGCC